MTCTPRLILGGSVEGHSLRDQLAVPGIHIVDLDDDLDADGADLCRVTFLDAEVESARPANLNVPGLSHEHIETERSDIEVPRSSQVGHEDEEMAQADA